MGFEARAPKKDEILSTRIWWWLEEDMRGQWTDREKVYEHWKKTPREEVDEAIRDPLQAGLAEGAPKEDVLPGADHGCPPALPEGGDAASTLREENPNALLADGFESCLIGVARRCGQPTLAVYDYGRAVQHLMVSNGMAYEEAVEYMEFNVVGAWMGENTPLWLYRG